MPEPDTALYLFCFARPSLDPLPNTPGVEETSRVVVQNFPAAAAVLCEVSVHDFCGPAAERRLQDLAWVGPRACRHEQVIEQIMRLSPVLPARFGTLFSSLTRLREFVDGHSKAIAGFLRRVEGHQEWGVKAVLDRDKAREAPVSEEQEARLAALPEGTRYIQQQRMRAEREKSLRRRVQEVCQRVAGDLRSQAAAFAERKVVPGADDEDGPVETLLNWAFLLPQDCVAVFREAVEQANRKQAGQGLSFHASGPWPPYSFAPPLGMEGRS